MKKTAIAIMCLFVVTSCATKSSSPSEDKALTQLKQEIVQDLTENILPFWAKYSPDPSGGFYGVLNFDGTPRADAPKGGILNARLVWTFSAAYRLLKDEQYLTLANRAQRYFIDNFIDPEYGGSFYMLSADGEPLDMKKVTYQNAYSIYCLSEHYRATGNQESLDAAIAIYNKLVEYAYDPVNGGFIELFSRDWQMNDDYPNKGEEYPKTMNANLHVLEALTNLYRAWNDEGLKRHLKEEIEVMTQKVLNRETWHQRLFFTMDWQSQKDVDSYGHDIEFAWLLVEAAEALGDEEILEDARHIAVNMVAVQLEEGINENGVMIYEKSGDHANTNVEWWPQTETLIGCLSAWQISGDKKFFDAAVRTWNWINTYMIDREYGEWYSNVYADGTPQKDRVKANQWRCPYHNSRVGFEVIMRFCSE